MDENDDLRSIDESTKKHFGTHVSPFSMRRWIAVGLGKPPVRLKAVRLGGRYFVRDRDVLEFKEATSDPGLFNRKQKTARVEKAKKRLIKAGA